MPDVVLVGVVNSAKVTVKVVTRGIKKVSRHFYPTRYTTLLKSPCLIALKMSMPQYLTQLQNDEPVDCTDDYCWSAISTSGRPLASRH